MIAFENIPVTTDATPAEEQTTRPIPGEVTGPQSNISYGWASGWGCSNAATVSNPCGFPRYGRLYLGTYETYDWMLEHPIIQHARSQVVDPIKATGWGYEAKKGTPEKRLEFIKDQIEAIRFQTVSDALRALDYGWAPFEKVWEIVGGQYVLVDLKALNVDRTGVLADEHGEFAGLRPDGRSKSNQDRERDLDVHKSWVYTYDSKFRNLFGRARLENMRATAWRDWLDAATDLVKLCKKISGKLGILTTPTGSVKMGDGSTKSWADIANNIGQVLAQDPVLLHLYNLMSQMPATGQPNFDQNVELLKASAVSFRIEDFGSNAPAIASLLDRMKQNEERMFAGYFQSPRTGMATQGGTKADAQQHTDTATINSENLATEITMSFNRWVVNDILELNFGREARGSVWVSPGKLTDANLAIDNKVLDAVLKDPDLGPQLLEQVDVDSIVDRRGIPHENTIALKLLPADNAGDPSLNDPNAETGDQQT